MGKLRNISELVDYLKATKDVSFRAMQLAVLQATVEAEGLAKKNVSRLFTGTRFRPKSGNLLNSIFSVFEIKERARMVTGFVGVRSKKGRAGTQPYGRIHEYGGKIVPRRAKWLWIPIRTAESQRWENLTPSDFVDEMQKPRSEYHIIPGRRARSMVAVYDQAARYNKSGQSADLILLFALKKEVTIRKRPYVRPAVAKASQKIPALYAMRLKELSA